MIIFFLFIRNVYKSNLTVNIVHNTYIRMLYFEYNYFKYNVCAMSYVSFFNFSMVVSLFYFNCRIIKLVEMAGFRIPILIVIHKYYSNKRGFFSKMIIF